jgi:cob(I)alamin adenosyltransferase
MARIYTRSGDDGSTGLWGGARRPKDDLRIEAIGAVDEANAALGMARVALAGEAVLDPLLARLQNELFDLGADLAAARPDEPKALRIVPAQVVRLEQEIDRLEADLPPLSAFILPGGSAGAAALHLARTVVRRAERRVVALAAAEPVGAPVRLYLNRLSDLLFVAARHASRATGDVPWQPGTAR